MEDNEPTDEPAEENPPDIPTDDYPSEEPLATEPVEDEGEEVELPIDIKSDKRSSLSGKASEGSEKAISAAEDAIEEGDEAYEDQPGGDCAAAKLLHLTNINPVIQEIKYDTYGSMEARAVEIEAHLNPDDDNQEFEKVIRANVDDAHAMGQTPLTFLRQVLAIACYPTLLGDSSFPDDAKSRAKLILEGCKGNSIGSFTDAAGIEAIRKHVALYIEKRDGAPCKWQDVILTSGSSEAMKGVLKFINCKEDGKKAGVMVPMPTSRLYRAYVESQNMHEIGYYLNEDDNWSIDIDELTRAYCAAAEECQPRAIIVINPGNPTGHVLTKDNIEAIIKFAHDKQLLICADELSQGDLYVDDIEFVSFKKVLKQMERPYSIMELASFMSSSTGYMGEGGLRGGYVEFTNMMPDVKAMYIKYISTKVCPPVLGQAAIEVLVNPPQPDEPSYGSYTDEKNEIHQSYKTRAGMVTVAFNSFKNFQCTPIIAGKHAFPLIKFPQAAITAAEEADQPPDVFFTSQLLEQKGICVTPGSEYGQKADTYHLGLSIALPVDDLNLMLGRFKQFNQRFNEKFACKCKRKKSIVEQ